MSVKYQEICQMDLTPEDREIADRDVEFIATEDLLDRLAHTLDEFYADQESLTHEEKSSAIRIGLSFLILKLHNVLPGLAPGLVAQLIQNGCVTVQAVTPEEMEKMKAEQAKHKDPGLALADLKPEGNA